MHKSWQQQWAKADGVITVVSNILGLVDGLLHSERSSGALRILELDLAIPFTGIISLGKWCNSTKPQLFNLWKEKKMSTFGHVLFSRNGGRYMI